MPKKVLKIDKFDGGLNTDTEQRDIKENEFNALAGLSMENIGVLKLLGSLTVAGSDIISAGPTFQMLGNPASAHFSFQSDWNSQGSLKPSNYLVLSDKSHFLR